MKLIQFDESGDFKGSLSFYLNSHTLVCVCSSFWYDSAFGTLVNQDEQAWLAFTTWRII